MLCMHVLYKGRWSGRQWARVTYTYVESASRKFLLEFAFDMFSLSGDSGKAKWIETTKGECVDKGKKMKRP